jgi:hypothetical protein
VGSITTLPIAVLVWPALGGLKKALRRREMEHRGRER